jgi:hypothetical protein
MPVSRFPLGYFVGLRKQAFLLVLLIFRSVAWANGLDSVPGWNDVPNFAGKDFEGDYDSRDWKEMAVQLPPAPQDANLTQVYVSASTDNKFFVDTASVSVGSDGVVRYALVAISANGVRNVSYEGMRCATKEVRLYAFGHRDGSWAKARANQWRRIYEQTSNRQHAELYQAYFCPDGAIVFSRDEALSLLSKGGRPPTETY